MRYDTEEKPGLSNLIELFAAASGVPSRTWPPLTTATGPLKADLAEPLVEVLGPVRERYREITADPDVVPGLLDKGAPRRARSPPRPCSRAREAIGLLAP